MRTKKAGAFTVHIIMLQVPILYKQMASRSRDLKFGIHRIYFMANENAGYYNNKFI